MLGWISVAVIVAMLVVAAFLAVRRAARRWWDYPAIVGLAAALIVPLYRLATGDISRYLPAAIWSDDADGKDQIIMASIASTFLLPLIVSASSIIVVKTIWRRIKAALPAG
jgi:hypothetical protein